MTLKKKYPIIFHYYEELSDHLNAYLQPVDATGGMNINIPSYVSNGYLVFCPDIHYKIGDPMQGAFDAVVSAAEHLATFSFVDKKRMGIEGGSWGGIQTNYLVANTNLFAAVCSASGTSDWISGYGTILERGESLQGDYEGLLGDGKSLSEAPEIYIKNSSVLMAHKVTTPLLIMHTRNDGICPYQNMLEFFTDLRRLGKRVWMLSYNGGHGIAEPKDCRDFSIRMMQFFDHYLKDKPAPIWMTRGISAERQGLDNGLAYDNEIKTPGPGLLTVDKQKKVDSLITRKPILIELK